VLRAVPTDPSTADAAADAPTAGGARRALAAVATLADALSEQIARIRAASAPRPAGDGNTADGERSSEVTSRPASRAPAEAAAPELPFLALLAEDFATHDRNLSEPGFWAVATHRIGARSLDERRPRAERALLDLCYRAMFRGVDTVWGIHLPRTTALGRRVRLWHNGCMLLTAKSIGSDVHLRHDTTFGPLQAGLRRADASTDLPVIEDGVDIGSGACIMGDVRVGRGAVVGANSVVIKNVPPEAVVLGVPARIVPR
jgi:serine O-acetyltransferase